MLAKSQLAFLRDPVLVGDAVGVGGTQDATVSVTRGGTVRVEIAEADRGEVSQLRPVFVVTACEGAFDAGTAAPIVDVEDCCSCILQRSTMSHHTRQMLAGRHLGAESKQLHHDAHAVCRARHTRAGWLGGVGEGGESSRRRKPSSTPRARYLGGIYYKYTKAERRLSLISYI